MGEADLGSRYRVHRDGCGLGNVFLVKEFCFSFESLRSKCENGRYRNFRCCCEYSPKKRNQGEVKDVKDEEAQKPVENGHVTAEEDAVKLSGDQS